MRCSPTVSYYLIVDSTSVRTNCDPNDALFFMDRSSGEGRAGPWWTTRSTNLVPGGVGFVIYPAITKILRSIERSRQHHPNSQCLAAELGFAVLAPPDIRWDPMYTGFRLISCLVVVPTIRAVGGDCPPKERGCVLLAQRPRLAAQHQEQKNGAAQRRLLPA